MKFENYYSTGDYGYSDFSTILPFFGFKYKKDKVTHYHSHGGDIKVTHEYGNTYKVEKTRQYDSTSYSDIDTYTRSYTPSIEELRIESEFLDALSKVKIKHYRSGVFFLFKPLLRIKRIPRLRMPGLFKKPIHLLQTPYIEPTLEDYHMTRGGASLLTNSMFSIGKFMLKYFFFFALFVGYLIFEVLKLPQSDASIYFCIFFPPALSLLMMGVSEVCSYIIRGFKKPLKQMSRRYKERLKTQYYLRMRYLYGRKMGKLLKEYSILKESKQRKL